MLIFTTYSPHNKSIVLFDTNTLKGVSCALVDFCAFYSMNCFIICTVIINKGDILLSVFNVSEPYNSA